MPPISTNDALEVGANLGASPPRAADGGPELSPAPVSLPVIQPMSLCELGPCRNLHVLTQKMEIQEPMDGSPAPFHTVTIRTCYPSPGIEYDLTAEPVKSCSKWFPETDESAVECRRAQEKVVLDRWGQPTEAYTAFLKSWDAPPE